jgi:hypothetical protein
MVATYVEVIGTVEDQSTIKMLHCINLDPDVGMFISSLVPSQRIHEKCRLKSCKQCCRTRSRSKIL